MIPLIPILGGLIGAVGGIKIMSKLSPKEFKEAEKTIQNPSETFEYNREKVNTYFEGSAKDPCTPKDFKTISKHQK